MNNTSQSLYDYLFVELPDPRIQDWPLMTDPFPSILIVILYLLIVKKWGPKFMENRKPYNLKNVIRCYNIFQIVGCFLLFFGLGLNGWFTGDLSFGCEPVDKSNNPKALRLAAYCWWCYMLKIAELIETVFFILRKKYSQVTILHIYHHASTFLITWIGVKYAPGGMTTFPMIVNCFVHFIMYGYYFMSTLGPKWQQRLQKYKNKITVIQMIQFSLFLIHIAQAFKPNCDYPYQVGVVFLPDVLLVFYMFFKFYKQSYTNKNKSN